jgi:anti-anti-sigma regulatory factor
MCLVARLGTGWIAQDRPRIETRPSRTDRVATVVELHGAHGLATREAVRVSLALLRGDVLVDLSKCTFIGSTVIDALIEATRTLAREGSRLELVLPPPDSQVSKALVRAEMHDLVHEAGA